MNSLPGALMSAATASTTAGSSIAPPSVLFLHYHQSQCAA